MTHPDLNLLVALDALLAEGNVTRAAKRLRLSPSAMSRTLARLRATTGDPLLVRAGRRLVPSPRALELRAIVGPAVSQALAMLSPQERLNVPTVKRTFTLQTSDGFVENFGPRLLAEVAAEAPEITLHFVQKVTRDGNRLREGTVDFETGVVGADLGPEIRTQSLFRDRLVGVVRKSHPLSRGKMTAARYLAEKHILIHRGEAEKGPVDADLAALGLERKIGTVLSGFAAALTLARSTDLVATVPDRHTVNLRTGLHTFALPFPSRQLTVSLLWHPRMDADPAHRWLREKIRTVCTCNVAR
ncbi:MAG: LysR substrate-binding domain-containing protein [Candidatus Didemnitutus sp.]|jgi:DNA-binding transcriptional LysR family regulator|nr:LysR substrate-binding domain-containing protein [Candidatus Didemnitutus sp.]